jgi:hypothetical protein
MFLVAIWTARGTAAKGTGIVISLVREVWALGVGVRVVSVFHPRSMLRAD